MRKIEDYNKEYVSGIAVHSCDENKIFSKMSEEILSSKEVNHISITNTESMYYAEKIPEHKEYINTAAFSLCDGMGSVIAGKFQGLDIKRFHGPDFMLKSCEFGVEKEWSHFFYGGKEGVADVLVENLKKKYPNLKVSGTYCPPFRDLTPEEEKDMIKYIKDLKPDIIWVGLGLLKQERWIARYKKDINVPWAVGVGAAFDFYAGTVKRAPYIYQKFGMEWLYRLMREPRMFKRNINSYVFMFKGMFEGIQNKYTNKKDNK
jgi:N-acetylglucosaminyldiphosphoundecaprenol N-acetyl-beta-D-mannosaminyltransferase